MVVKRPRTAFDEWVDETGQRDIAKTKFPEYSLLLAEPAGTMASSVPDVVKAPFLAIYRQKLRNIFL